MGRFHLRRPLGLLERDDEGEHRRELREPKGTAEEGRGSAGHQALVREASADRLANELILLRDFKWRSISRRDRLHADII